MPLVTLLIFKDQRQAEGPTSRTVSWVSNYYQYPAFKIRVFQFLRNERIISSSCQEILNTETNNGQVITI